MERWLFYMELILLEQDLYTQLLVFLNWLASLKRKRKLGMMVYSVIPATQEAEVGGSWCEAYLGKS
jgi:hypothetical protein